MRSTLMVCCAKLALAVTCCEAAQSRAPSLAQRGVDLVTLKDGTRLRGSVLGRDQTGATTIVVRSEWLRANLPGLFGRVIQPERQRLAGIYATLIQRIDDWVQQRPDDADLMFYLRTQRKRLERLLSEMQQDSEGAKLEFLSLPIDARRIAKSTVQPSRRKRIFLLAWRERLDRPEYRTVTDLAGELRDRGIDVKKASADLSDRLPSRLDDERQWAARRAIVEYQYRRTIDFQGTGGMLIRTDTMQGQADSMPLVAQIMRTQLAGGLQELLEPRRHRSADSRSQLEPATREAEREGALGVRVTRIRQDILRGRATVESRFLGRMPDGTWETVWLHTETRDTSKVQQERIHRIQQDPQVRQVQQVIQTLGLNVDTNAFQTALRFGAATMEAQEAANGRFYEFRDTYLERLDRPPLP